MKYAVVLVFTICSVWAAPHEEVEAQAAQFGYGGYGQYPMKNSYQNPMGMGVYGGYGNEQDGAMNPSKYYNMKNEDFGIDYSLSCSNSCGCRQSCVIIWWQPCWCRCPPPCPTTPEETTTEEITTPTLPDDDTPTPTPDDCNGGGCCGGCSCQPCMIIWMCPPRCKSSCCGGSSSCCNGSNNSCCNSGGGSSSCCNGSNNSCCNSGK